MARAFLSLSTELTEAFSAAQDDLQIRALVLSIEEETINLKSLLNVGGGSSADFDGALTDSLISDEAALIVYCSDDTRVTGEPSKWILVAYIPDDCRVRDKMLYSSSREDIKKSLGLGYFVSEYYANTKEDLTWAQVLAYASKNEMDGPLTEKERLIQEENKLSQVESNVTSSTAMGALPFNLSEAVISALAQFKAQEINWVDMYVENEEVQLSDAKKVDTTMPLVEHVSATSGRFLAVQVSTAHSTVFTAATSGDVVNFFVFSCPDEIQVRMKMTMSSCKSSVVAAATCQGIKFEKTLEIRAPEDLDEALRLELSGPSSSSGGGASSASANLSYVKPSRPGRVARKTQAKKFVPDADSS